MKFECDRRQLADAFAETMRVVPTKSPKEILKHVRLEATADGEIRIFATNLEIGIEKKITGASVSQPGVVMLPGEKANTLLKASNDGVLAIDLDEKNVATVRGEKGKFAMPTLDASDYPAMPVAKVESQPIAIDAEALRELFVRTMYACDEGEARFALHGICLENGAPSELTAVATDSRRLAIAKAECVISEQAEHALKSDTVIIPVQAIHVMNASLVGGDAELEIYDSFVLLKTADTTIYAQRIAGRFPNWKKAEREPGHRSEFFATELTAALRQAAVFTSADSRGIEFNFEDGTLSLRGIDAGVGESNVQLAVDFKDELHTTIDPRFALQFLRTVDRQSKVTLDVFNKDMVVILKENDSENMTFIMPLVRDNG